MPNPCHLQVGSVTLTDFAGSATGYKITAVSFPEPEPDGLDGHLPAVRQIELRVEGTTLADLRGKVNALRRECVRDETLYFQPDVGGSRLTCRIREASLVEPDWDPIFYDHLMTNLTLTLTTDPYWLGPWGDDVSPTVALVPGHFDVTSVAGEVDALLSIRVIGEDNAAALAIGVKPEPVNGYDYLDEYGASGAGTSDANAYGTYKLASSALTPTLAAIGSAPAYLANENRGRHLILARLDSNATAASTVTYRAVQRTEGSSIAVSTDVSEAAVTAPSLDLVGVELGDVQIPSAQIPSYLIGETTLFEQALGGSTASMSADATGLNVFQTFDIDSHMVITAFEFEVVGTPSPSEWEVSLQVWNGSSWVSVRSVDATLSVGVNKVEIDPYGCNPGFTWRMALIAGGVTPTTIGLKYNTGAGGFTDGAGSATGGGITGVPSGDFDWKFAVYGYNGRRFTNSTIIQAADSADAAKVANLDYVQRIPTDFACIVYRLGAYTAAPAIYYDGDTDYVYIADADGIGPSVLDKCEVRKPLRLAPGVTNRVVIGACQADEVLGGATVTYAVRPRYLTATG